MNNLFTESAQNVLQIAQKEAKQFKHNAVGTEHILLGLVKENDGVAGVTLRELTITSEDVIEEIERLTGYGEINVNSQRMLLPYSPKSRSVLSEAQDQAKMMDSEKIGTEHILLAILKNVDSLASRILINLGLSLSKTKDALLKNMGVSENSKGKRGSFANSMGKRYAKAEKKRNQKSTLDSLATDLTQYARENKIDPVVGRDKEIKRSIQILSRRSKNNPVLVGEPGVGKTAIVEGLALAIVNKEVPSDMQNKRIMMLEMGSLVAGTKYRGEFEDRLKKIIEEVKEDRNIILFIDELHTLIGAGGAEGAIDASNILKPALARGEIQLIGATTSNEYQKYIEKDAALERRFAVVKVDEPSKDTALEIVRNLKVKYEGYHNVEITDEALKNSVSLSTRYLTNRFLPDKAIDLIDEASAKVKIANQENIEENSSIEKLEQELVNNVEKKDEAIENQDFEKAAQYRQQELELRTQITDYMENKDSKAETELERPKVTGEDIAEIVAEWTGIPVTKMTESDNKKALNLEDNLHKRVIGQDEAVTAVSKAIRRASSGLKDKNRPIGSFLFLGPTGVGKTELAKALAEEMFDSEDDIIRIDMSEYMEQYSTSKLVGSAPGYVGYEEGGQLTEKVRRNPYSVVLLDEVEKAHPDVYNILLQVLDDGYLSDAKGRKVDFRNTIIIMTSNLGATQLQDDKNVGFSTDASEENDYKVMKSKIEEETKRFFRPEFINRLDETIIFHKLSKENLQEIVKLMVNSINGRLGEKGISMKMSSSAYDQIIKNGYNSEYGARPMRRELQSSIEDPISEMILSGEVAAGDVIKVGTKDKKFTFKVENATKNSKQTV